MTSLPQQKASFSETKSSNFGTEKIQKPSAWHGEVGGEAPQRPWKHLWSELN